MLRIHLIAIGILRIRVGVNQLLDLEELEPQVLEVDIIAWLWAEAEDLKVVDTGGEGLDDLAVWVDALESEVRDGGGALPARTCLWSL